MVSSQVNGKLHVRGDGLCTEASWCEFLAGKLAGNDAPTKTGSSGLVSAAAVDAFNKRVAAAGTRCMLQMQATAAELAAAGAGFVENEASSVALLRAVDMPKVR